jgi:lipoyl(octanoyl) transferase
MADIKRLNIGPRELVSKIEQSLVDLLAEYQVTAYPKKDAPGVYVNESKIASLGLRIRKGLSFHGLSLNIDMNLEPFERINPCGYADMKMTQLADIVAGDQAQLITIETISQKLVTQLKTHMPYPGIQDLGNQLT